jgi:hypothetical protein
MLVDLRLQDNKRGKRLEPPLHASLKIDVLLLRSFISLYIALTTIKLMIFATRRTFLSISLTLIILINLAVTDQNTCQYDSCTPQNTQVLKGKDDKDLSLEKYKQTYLSRFLQRTTDDDIYNK